MTYVDLLTYLTDVQKIEKNDMAELLAIPQKHIDGVLCGQMPLKKKWLKNLSLYTGIPKDAILAGNFVLNIPDGEPAPVIKDAYVSEAIREANTQRLNAYAKKRYKTFHDDVVAVKVMGIISIATSWIIPLALMVIYSITAASDIIKIMLMGIIPAMIGVSVIRNVFKFAKKGVAADEKTFKYFSILSIIQTTVFIASLVAFEWVSSVAVVAIVLVALPVLYHTFIVKSDKLSYAKHILVSLLCAGAYFCLFLLFISGEKFTNAENATQIFVSSGLFWSGWASSYFSFGSILLCKFYYCKRNGISKHFGAINKKKVFKNSKIAKSIISLVLVGVIIFSIIYIAPVVVFDKIISSASAFPGEEPTETKYLDYDKGDISFAADEEVIIIEKENYSLKIPAYLERNENATISETYQNKEKMSSLMIEDTYLDYDEFLFADAEDDSERKYNERIRNAIIERYGFFPKGEYEFYKLMKLISEDTISPLNRDLFTSVSILKSTQQLVGDDVVYLYEDSKKCLCIRENRIEREDGTFSCIYNISGNANGDYDKFVSITVLVVTGTADMDLPFKIINSIEMK